MRRAGQLMRGIEGLRHRAERLRDIETGQDHGARRLGPRQHLDADLGQRRERAVRAGHQLREIVAGDVLHHPPAGLEDLAKSAHGFETEEVIARRALANAARPREIASEHAAQSRRLVVGAEQRAPIAGLESEHLTRAIERRFDLAERRRRAGGQHQLRRLVIANARERAEIEHMRQLQRPAEAALAAAGDQLQRLFAGERLPDDRDELLLVGGAEMGHGPTPRGCSPAPQPSPFKGEGE